MRFGVLCCFARLKKRAHTGEILGYVGTEKCRYFDNFWCMRRRRQKTKVSIFETFVQKFGVADTE